MISQAELMALRRPANDDGYYFVLTRPPAGDLAESSLAEAAALLRLQVPELRGILSACQPLPLGRVATAEEAAPIGQGLRALGIEPLILAHEELHLGVASQRIRALEVSDDSLCAIPTRGSERVALRWDQVALLVAGRLFVNRQEVEERKRRGRNQMVDSRQLSSDESVLDLYTRSDEINLRINANNFDFSCLGPTKGPTTFENFAALVSMLRDRATAAHFDDGYNQARSALATVWPLDQQTRKGDWRRSGTGKVDVATVTTTDNEAQFTRYSRLRHCLRLREPMNSK